MASGSYGSPVYFRISVTAGVNDQALMRNRVYRITINDLDFYNGYTKDEEACYAKLENLFFATECLENI